MTNPGTVLTTIGTVTDESILNAFGGAPGVINLPVASFSLAANARYWIELSDANPNMPTVSFWASAPGNGGTGVAGEFFFFAGLVFPNTEGPFQMKVTASTSAVPEPSTAILAGIGAVGFIAYGAGPVTAGHSGRQPPSKPRRTGERTTRNNGAPLTPAAAQKNRNPRY
jgi:hypothetical protein